VLVGDQKEKLDAHTDTWNTVFLHTDFVFPSSEGWGLTDLVSKATFWFVSLDVWWYIGKIMTKRWPSTGLSTPNPAPKRLLITYAEPSTRFIWAVSITKGKISTLLAQTFLSLRFIY